eukprot:CAMPEP_0202343338 /NCGR_PEP_ID=MMETSP1126-20121109/3501_1 /ASSEMBLY_ACC=CAM_ASM_000457 /TAXON_ID=3047 /ORGANISM="Dunaliella tertiolecta, Strain CCMP1320" /LENGTH=330 /DNA_ID=CAMNT_0048934391 /DNA_START=154 /DNA_END=1146 /DNA_ORIENTATION=+
MNGMDMSAHSEHQHGMDMGPLSFSCDGKPWSGMGPERPGEWWIFFCAGLAMTLWCTHWTISIFRRYLSSVMSNRHPYHALPYHPIPRLAGSWPIEGALKASVSLVGIFSLLLFSHPASPRICGPNTPRAGHLSPDALYVSEDIWILFGFLLSGMIDVIGHYTHLPNNMEHAFLAAAFGLQAFLLRKEVHGDMLDSMMFLLLFYAVFGTTLSVLAEMVAPSSFWAGCARLFTTWMQAIWYFACARFLYEDRLAWSTIPPDMAPGMFVPVVFVGWMNTTGLGLLLAFILVRWWASRHPEEYEQVALLGDPSRAPSAAIQLGKASRAKNTGLS